MLNLHMLQLTNDKIYQLTTLAESDHHLLAHKLLDVCTHELELTLNQKKYLMKKSFNWAVEILNDIEATSHQVHEFSSISNNETIKEKSPIETRKKFATKYMKVSYSLATQLNINESKGIQQAALEFFLKIYHEDAQWENILKCVDLLNGLNTTKEQKEGGELEPHSFQSNIIKLYCTIKINSDKELSNDVQMLYESKFELCLDSPDLLHMKQFKRIISTLCMMTRENKSLNNDTINKKFAHNLCLKSFRFGEVRFCHDNESMEELYCIAILYAIQNSLEEMAYNYLSKYIQWLTKSNVKKVTANHTRILDFCDAYVHNLIQTGYQVNKDKLSMAKNWLSAMVLLAKIPTEHTVYYHRFLIQLVDSVNQLEGYDSAQKILAHHLSSLELQFAIKDTTVTRKLVFALLQYQMKLSWCHQDMNTLRIALDRFWYFYNENDSTSITKDNILTDETYAGCHTEAKTTILDLVKYCLNDINAGREITGDIKNADDTAMQLESLHKILKQSVFTEDFLNCDDLAIKVWLRLLIKMWKILITKEEPKYSETDKDVKSLNKSDNILLEITELLANWISVRQAQCSSFTETNVTADTGNITLDAEWVSQIAWNLALQTNNNQIRQRFFGIAAKSLSMEANGKLDLENTEVISQILFCLTMELAVIIQIMQENTLHTVDISPEGDDIALRTTHITQQCLNILEYMGDSLGTRTKRILLVYIIKGALLTSQDETYVVQIVENIIEYIKNGNSDFLLPQVVSAAISAFPRKNDNSKLSNLKITLLKESIDKSLIDMNEPKIDLLPACYDLVDQLIPTAEQITSCDKQEDAIRVIGKAVQYIYLSLKGHDITEYKVAELNEEKLHQSNSTEGFVTALIVKLWNTSICIELKFDSNTNKSIVFMESAIKLKELAKTLGKLLPETNEITKKLFQDDSHENIPELDI